MKCLVTGGAGFIGSHLSAALVAQGHEVIVVDNLTTGAREKVPDGVTFVEGDVRNTEKLTQLCSGVQVIFHLAALPNVQQSIDDLITTHDCNINSTVSVVEAARNAGVRRIVYSASCAAYGEPDVFPTPETSLPNPLSPYGLQKYVGEHYVRLFHSVYGGEAVSLRYFNVYGPRMMFTGAYASVISVFLRQKKAGELMTITGDGTQTRDFVYVEDVVRANIAAATSQAVGSGEVINIGTGTETSVNQIAAHLGGDTTHIDPRIEPKRALADVSKAQELLGWQPQVSLEQGIAKTVAWFDSLSS